MRGEVSSTGPGRVTSGWPPPATRGGMNVALADGSVRFLAAAMNPATWWAACTLAGGEVNGPDW